jgi:hypothetical protein
MIFSKKKKENFTLREKKICMANMAMHKGRELLHAKRNHLHLIYGEMFSVLALIFPLILCDLLSCVIEKDLVVTALYFGFAFFTALPMFFGLLKTAGNAYLGEDIDQRELFCAYESFHKYIRVLFLGFINLLKLITPISLGLILGVVLDKLLSLTALSPEIIAVLCIALWLLVAFLFYLPMQRLYATSYLVVCENFKTIEAIKCSWKITRGRVWQIIKLRIKLLPLTTVSVAVVCMPLFAYTLPYRLCIYSVVCNKLRTENDRSENPLRQYEEILNEISPEEEESEGEEEINEQV